MISMGVEVQLMLTFSAAALGEVCRQHADGRLYANSARKGSGIA